MATTPANPAPDPWTPDQEATLLKALVKFKPVGLHAHFRMLSIHQALLTSGTCTADDEHTRIPGIWTKLRTLYDLDRLNEREDAVITSGGLDGDGDGEGLPPSVSSSQQSNGSNGGAGGKEYWRDFELPRDGDGDFERLMWERRLAPEGSPDWSAGGRRESAVADTDEPRSSPPVTGSVARGTRSGRRGGRVSRLREEAEGTASDGRRSRRESKAASEVGTKDDDGDENMEDVDDDDDGEEAVESEEDEEESEEPDEEEKRSGPAKRGRGGRRGRGRGRRRRG